MVARLKPLTPELSAVHQFGALLRRLRIKAGYTQPQLAVKVYTSKSTLSRAETGARRLPRDLAEVCDTLFGASGVLIAAWHSASSTRPIEVRSEQTRRGTITGYCLPGLCALALRSRHARNAETGGGLPISVSWQVANPPPADAGRVGRRDRYRPRSSGGVELRRPPLPPIGDGLPDPPPIGPSPRASDRVTPGARGRSPRGPAGGDLVPRTYSVGAAPAVRAGTVADRV